MKEITIISGKGGTGKTTLTAVFASLAKNHILCDADVDAADLHLLMNPQVLEKFDFIGGGEASIDPEKCTECGICRQHCRFDAIDADFKVDPILCEGCGVCHYLCPEEAVAFAPKKCGEYFISDTRFGPMVHARLGIAEENSGKLVTRIRNTAREIAEKKGLDLILTDGPPGVGCPVIASLGGVDGIVAVSEPTVSGIHDLDRVVQLAKHFKIPVGFCINKFDLNEGVSEKLRQYAESTGAIYLGSIPFDPSFTWAMVQAKTLLEYDRNAPAAEKTLEIWKRLLSFASL